MIYNEVKKRKKSKRLLLVYNSKWPTNLNNGL